MVTKVSLETLADFKAYFCNHCLFVKTQLVSGTLSAPHYRNKVTFPFLKVSIPSRQRTRR